MLTHPGCYCDSPFILTRSPNLITSSLLDCPLHTSSSLPSIIQQLGLNWENSRRPLSIYLCRSTFNILRFALLAPQRHHSLFRRSSSFHPSTHHSFSSFQPSNNSPLPQFCGYLERSGMVDHAYFSTRSNAPRVGHINLSVKGIVLIQRTTVLIRMKTGFAFNMRGLYWSLVCIDTFRYITSVLMDRMY